jgi:hypothetical protein
VRHIGTQKRAEVDLTDISAVKNFDDVAESTVVQVKLLGGFIKLNRLSGSRLNE